MDMEELFGEIISVYTRAEAIDDGVLVDVTEIAKEAGFSIPVALTCGLWAEAVAWDEANGATQDEKGRLWDILMVLFFSIRTAKGNRCDGAVLRVPNKPGATRATKLPFYALCGPGDDAEPVLTVMLVGED